MPRLTLEQAEQLNNYVPETIFEGAAIHMAQGWAVFPLAERSKEPYAGTSGVKEASRDPAQFERWCAEHPNANIGGATDGFLVVDIDVRSGGKRPLDWQTRFHASGRGDGGGHLIYRLTAEQRHLGFKSGSGRLGPGMDIKTGAGSYVVLPDSVHPDTGEPYVSDRMPIQILPDELARKILEAQNSKRGGEGETDKGRSILSHLLNNPPSEGGRNEWLTKVCGHYAKHFRKQPDLYRTMVVIANEQLRDPLDEAEVDKTAQSIWNTETSGHPEREFANELVAERGYLVSAPGGWEILHGVLDGPKEATMVVAEPWSDFDIKLNAKLVDPDKMTTWYDLILMRKQDHVEIDQLIEAKTFGRPSDLKAWLAGFTLGLAEMPERPIHKSLGWSTRLSRYISSQAAPTMTLRSHLGWDNDECAYLTHLNAIGSDGASAFRHSHPYPWLASNGTCKYEYGMAGTREQAREFLAEVMTFHDENSMAAFGAWWAANLVKQWLMPMAGMFPFMAIEAASESGKTEGAFGMLVRLSGAIDGAGYYTTAALRDVLSTNSNGIVWIDDVDDPTKYFELVRSLTMGGVLSKKGGENFVNTEQYKLVSSFMLSGEALGLEKQKALLDRSVLISPPSPTDRMSKKTPGIEQYRDILAMKEDLRALGGEQAVSGHYLWMVAGWQTQVEQAFRDVQGQSGRAKARDALLRAGARVLDAMLAAGPRDTKKAWSGEGTWAVQLESYLSASEPSRFKGDNKLFIELLPWAISKFGWPEAANAAGGGRGVFIEGMENGAPVVWFSPRRLAEVWSEYHHGKIDPRLDTQKSIENQAKQAGLFNCETAERKRFRVSDRSENARAYYYAISGEMAQVIVERASQ